jgi:hypothetical protein
MPATAVPLSKHEPPQTLLKAADADPTRLNNYKSTGKIFTMLSDQSYHNLA